MARRKTKTDAAKKTRRPPPRYSSRRVQLRLMLLVASCMTILILMPEAADPENYLWMGFSVDEADAPLDRSHLDKKSPPNGAAVGILGPAKPGGDENSLDVARRDAWKHLLDGISPDQLDLLNKALWAQRHGQKLTPDELSQWALLVNRFDQGWQRYLARAEASLADLPAADREAWRPVVERLAGDWHDRLKPALLLPLDDAEPQPQQAEQLAALQAVLDARALARVYDDTVYNMAEKDAWFRMFEILGDSSQADIEQQSIGDVGYLQLRQQSEDYRGKLVTIRGTALRSYTVKAPQNLLGIEKYYVFWVQPEGGPSSPIVVYSLSIPDQFPVVLPKTSDPHTNKINERVAFSGFYFKRWEYVAQDGVHREPLVLAKTPTWQPPRLESTTPVSTVLIAIAACAGVAGVLAVAIAAIVFFWSKSNHDVADLQKPAKIPDDQIATLNSIPPPPGIEDVLAGLARGERTIDR